MVSSTSVHEVMTGATADAMRSVPRQKRKIWDELEIHELGIWDELGIPIRQTFLVGGLEHGWIMTFHSVGNVIIPTDEIIFFRGVGQPPTRQGGARVSSVAPKH